MNRHLWLDRAALFAVAVGCVGWLVGATWSALACIAAGTILAATRRFLLARHTIRDAEQAEQLVGRHRATTNQTP